jgi:energy-coupling factor transport system permease protein
MKLTCLHPGTLLLYYIILMLFVLCFNNIYYIVSGLTLILILLSFQIKFEKLVNMAKFFIPMAIFILIFYPIVYNYGSGTQIHVIGDIYMSFEVFIGGCIMVILMYLVTLLFVSFNAYVDNEKILYLGSKRYPYVSMIGVLAMRLVPYITQRFNDIIKVFTYNKKKQGTLKSMGSILIILMGWSLEEFLMIAKSMKARGYGVKKRTTYLMYKLHRIDYTIIIFTLLCSGVLIYGVINGYGDVHRSINTTTTIVLDNDVNVDLPPTTKAAKTGLSLPSKQSEKKMNVTDWSDFTKAIKQTWGTVAEATKETIFPKGDDTKTYINLPVGTNISKNSSLGVDSDILTKEKEVLLSRPANITAPKGETLQNNSKILPKGTKISYKASIFNLEYFFSLPKGINEIINYIFYILLFSPMLAIELYEIFIFRKNGI